MKPGLAQLQDKGMSRDMSVSQAENTFAFENRNVRILADGKDTQLAVTNERGNRKVENLSFDGTLIGWNVLNSYIILFTTDNTTDRIYRVAYSAAEDSFTSVLIYKGSLNFSTKSPIESIVDFENEDIQKIYWVDGRNVLRFMNFADDYLEKHLSSGTLDDSPVFDFADDTTWFDSNRPGNGNFTVTISKEGGGNERANGIVQYFITYYNKNGQETNWVYASPLVYLAPEGRGGEADGHNFNRVLLKIRSSECDKTFDYMRLYAVITTSYNMTRQAYLVSESEMKTDVKDYDITLVDDGRYLSTVDESSLLFLGSREVYPGTITHKDGTMFMGDLNVAGNTGLEELRSAIKELHDSATGESSIVNFELTEKSDDDIPYVEPEGYYPYESQLKYLNSRITTFKGGEKYRFAVRFRKDNGETTPAFWLGDKTNTYYPKMTASGNTIHRAVAKCTLPKSVISLASAAGYTYAQLMIAQATYADRSIKAQGIVNPTVFNLHERYYDEPFAQASWFYRPVGGDAAFEHFTSTAKADTSSAELQCSWWEEKETDGNDDDESTGKDNDQEETKLPTPLYYRDKDTGKLANPPYGYNDFNYVKQKITCYSRKGLVQLDGVPFMWCVNYWGKLTIEMANKTDGSAPDKGWFDANENDKEHYVKYEFTLGNKVGQWNAAKNRVVQDYLSACKEVDFPVNERWSSDDVSAWCVKARKKAKVWPGKKGKYTKETEWISVKYNDLNYGSKFSEYNREYFFVDNSIVTLNSPEIEYEKVNIDGMDADSDGLKFRIVGAVKMTSNITDYDLSSENHKFSGDTLIRKNFSHKNESDRISGLLTFPLYYENALELKSSDCHHTDQDDHTSDCFEFSANKRQYLIYPFQKSGSLIGYTTTDDNNESQIWDKLTSKKIANLHYGHYTEYSISPLPITANSIRQFTALTKQVYELKTIYGTKTYGANISDMIMMPGLCRYPVLKSDKDVAVDNPLSAEVGDDTIYSTDPVPLCYKSKAHAVIALSSYYDKEKDQTLQLVVPALFKDTDSESQDDEETETNENDGPYCPWLDGELGAGARYIIYKTNSAPLVGEDTESSSGAFGPAVAIFDSATGTGTFYAADLFPDSVSNAIIEAKKKTNSSIFAFIGVTPDGSDDYKMTFYLVNIVSQKSTKTTGYAACTLQTIDEKDTCILTIKASNVSDYEIVGYSIDVTDSLGKTFSETVELEDPSSEINYSLDVDKAGLKFPTSTDKLHVVFVVKYACLAGTELKCEFDMDVAYEQVKMESENVIVIDGADYLKVSDSDSMTLYNIYDSMYYTFDGNNFTADKSKVTDYNGYHQDILSLDHEFVKKDDPYLLIGELYLDYDETDESGEKKFKDTRYGGITEADVEANTFIPAGQMTALGEELIGNEGDTFFQRWDSVKTLPMGDDDVNHVIDIASVMLETHVNIEGRTDIDRGSTRLCDLDYDNFGKLNNVYSQEDNFLSSVNTDEMQDLDLYRTSVAWSLEKHAGEEVDNWTHVTLNSSINLDGDKGVVRALRRFSNSIIAFQDHAICEILFNSRTQVATTNDVPIEIANSGKVDGKRYITNKYGCRNKWSIVEGKSGLYFIDDLNRLICTLGESIDALSTKARLGAWVKDRLDGVLHEESWSPDVSGQQFVSFYDAEHSDVYFVKWNDTTSPCLVYSEQLGAFMGFFDYAMMPMLANVQDRLVSFRDGCLWLQNEGYYGRFFGADYPFWITFRVNSQSGADAIWSGIDYHADFMQVLDTDGKDSVGEDDFSGEDQLDNYMPDMTFEKLSVWNEYQKTDEFTGTWNRNADRTSPDYPNIRKKFRTWRTDIPRAKKDATNRFGLDRIRNPWIYLRLKKEAGDYGRCLMQLHDLIVRYFTEA